MHQRPIAALADALNRLGGQVETDPSGCLPAKVTAGGLRGGAVDISGAESSQFCSGLMMAGPFADRPLTITVRDHLVSAPFVEMTRVVMSNFGGVAIVNGNRITVENTSHYRRANFAIEPDATAASYLFAAAAITGGTATVDGLGHESCQGDLRFVQLLQQMGCQVTMTAQRTTVQGPARTGIDCDMRDISDTVPTIAAVAVFVDGPTAIRGVEHNRLKESDRIGDLARELRRIGVFVDEHPHGLTITPGKLRPAVIETYNDHRMAMSFAVIGLRLDGISIRNPSCVKKTYPNFFRDLAEITSPPWGSHAR